MTDEEIADEISEEDKDRLNRAFLKTSRSIHAVRMNRKDDEIYLLKDELKSLRDQIGGPLSSRKRITADWPVWPDIVPCHEDSTE